MERGNLAGQMMSGEISQYCYRVLRLSFAPFQPLWESNVLYYNDNTGAFTILG